MNRNLTSNRHGWRYTAAVIVLSVAITAPRTGLADDAEVLPKNVSRFYWDFYRYHPTTQRYNADGDREALAHPFSDAALDSSVLTSLAPLDAFVPGKATIGDVSVEYEYDIDVLDLGYSYGLTENLSIGFHLPYYWISNNVDTAFDNSSANAGLNPVTGACCIPTAAGGVPLDTDDVQNLVMSEYGFSEIDDWSRDGIGDTELGAKYRFYQQQDSAFAITGGLRIPSGYEDDADKLNDVAWSYGTYALLLRLHYDYLLSNLWNGSASSLQTLPARGNLVANLAFRYDYMLPDRKTMRIGDTPDQVLTTNRERVDRELGDLYNLEAALKYYASDALAFGLVYTYGGKFKDDIDGDEGYNYSSLEKNTDSSQQIIKLEASYSTLPAYQAQRSRLPMEFSLAYRERFKGDGPSSGQANPVLYTRWVVAGMKFWF
ncbi:MAG: transporter [Gammaproteobacteria bacterium]|nr:transporter [Gammaproteobacteria bacterium]